ncbi:hypothetical protein TNCV_2723111 [Trichonephila clavipes]|nr:hypothetical protein TNCV_2723111 [Trichonephila clavipes]
MNASDASKLLRIRLSISLLLFFFTIKTQAESLSEPTEIGFVIEDVVDLARQINSEMDSDDVQELLDSYNQGLTVDELIEMHESVSIETESLKYNDMGLIRGPVNVPVYPWPGVRKSLGKLDFTRSFGYNWFGWFLLASAKEACRSHAPRARNELQWALTTCH